MEMCKKILKMLRPALIVTLTLMVICGLGYPLLMNGLAGTLFPRQAGGNLVLADELAHTNAPGSRNAKRYQDVEELLRAGISVYTTVNVQHIESLNDMVESVTGISVRERIPDSVFDRADQVDIVDIEPQELIDRLKSGKVYRQQQAHRAMENFFTIENLTALREIALRRCADRVNRKKPIPAGKTRSITRRSMFWYACLPPRPMPKSFAQHPEWHRHSKVR